MKSSALAGLEPVDIPEERKGARTMVFSPALWKIHFHHATVRTKVHHLTRGFLLALGAWEGIVCRNVVTRHCIREASAAIKR